MNSLGFAETFDAFAGWVCISVARLVVAIFCLMVAVLIILFLAGMWISLGPEGIAHGGWCILVGTAHC